MLRAMIAEGAGRFAFEVADSARVKRVAWRRWPMPGTAAWEAAARMHADAAQWASRPREAWESWEADPQDQGNADEDWDAGSDEGAGSEDGLDYDPSEWGPQQYAAEMWNGNPDGDWDFVLRSGSE